MVEKLAYPKSEEEYSNLYEQLQRDAPKQVVEYYNKSWHPIKTEWVLGLKSSCGSFLNATNNR